MLKNGSQWGISIQYAVQDSPNGLAKAFIIGEDFIGNKPCSLILGDNIFYGHELTEILDSAMQRESGATIFAYHVNDPERYGIVEFDEKEKAINLVEKPETPKSNYAITGLYFYDNDVIEIAKSIKPSPRGELEITDVNKRYLEQDKLSVEIMWRGMAWLDTGTHASLMNASQFIQIIEERQGLKIACPEEIAWRKKYITDDDLKNIVQQYPENHYRKYLSNILKQVK